MQSCHHCHAAAISHRTWSIRAFHLLVQCSTVRYRSVTDHPRSTTVCLLLIAAPPIDLTSPGRCLSRSLLSFNLQLELNGILHPAYWHFQETCYLLIRCAVFSVENQDAYNSTDESNQETKSVRQVSLLSLYYLADIKGNTFGWASYHGK